MRNKEEIYVTHPETEEMYPITITNDNYHAFSLYSDVVRKLGFPYSQVSGKHAILPNQYFWSPRLSSWREELEEAFKNVEYNGNTYSTQYYIGKYEVILSKVCNDHISAMFPFLIFLQGIRTADNPIRSLPVEVLISIFKHMFNTLKEEQINTLFDNIIYVNDEIKNQTKAAEFCASYHNTFTFYPRTSSVFYEKMKELKDKPLDLLEGGDESIEETAFNFVKNRLGQQEQVTKSTTIGLLKDAGFFSDPDTSIFIENGDKQNYFQLK